MIHMILQPKDTTVAYRCPVCGSTILSVVGALALSGDMIKLKCTCGCSELVMQKAEEEKIRLTVPCIFCPTPHHYVVSRKLLMTRELFTFPCAYASVDILFVGSKGAVLKAIELSDNELRSIIDENELSGVREANEGDDLYGDEHIRDMILFVLGDLAEENHIHCDCPDGEGDFLVDQTRDSVRISCKKCGAFKDISCAGTSLDSQALFDCTHLYLQKEEI
jgi:ribosomal protein S14